MPPSAIAGTPSSRQAAAVSSTALNCGTPTPATTRVVQIEPGPMPILTASAPASISARAPSGVATLPATICIAFDSRLIRSTAPSTPCECPCAVSITIDVDLGRHQRLGPREPVLADPGRRRGAQPAQLVLVGQRMRLRLVHVLDGDQPDAAILVVHHQQLLQPVPVQQLPRLVAVDLGADRDQVLPRHQLVDAGVRVGRETQVAVGQDADQPPGLALDHRESR